MKFDPYQEILDIFNQAQQQSEEEKADFFIKRLKEHFNGLIIYFPMGRNLSISKRNKSITQEFNGSNHLELSKKYNVSVSWIYNILKQNEKRNL